MSLLVSGALALGSTALKIKGSNRREDEVNAAQERKEASDRIIRREQEGRIRRNQAKQGQVQIAQAEALSAAGGSASSGATNTVAQTQANVSENIGKLSTDMATSNINATLNQSILNAGKPSDFELFNQAVSPAINMFLSNQIANSFAPNPKREKTNQQKPNKQKTNK